MFFAFLAGTSELYPTSTPGNTAWRIMAGAPWLGRWNFRSCSLSIRSSQS